MKKYIILIIICLFSKQLVGQNIETYTPEVYSFAKQTFSPVSHYTGQASISIPIYTIQSNGISIPITMDYIGGDGLKTIAAYSSVGHGWRMTGGGCITRQVNFLPDESPYDPYSKGFFYMPANYKLSSTVRDDAYKLFSEPKKNVSGPGFKEPYEYAPDIFTFNFLGYSGYFFLGYDKKVYVQSDDIFDVQIGHSELGTSNRNSNRVGFHIIMTDNKGVKYTFGFTFGSIEFNEPVGTSAGPPTINAWYLSEIETPNNHKISFSYKDDDKSYNSHRSHFYYHARNARNNGTNFYYKYPVVLEKITSSNSVVECSYVIKKQIFTSENSIPLISSLSVKSNTEQVYQTDFTYTPSRNNNFYFLDALKINDKQYSFNYYQRENMPTTSDGSFYHTDFWGYHNGKTPAGSAMVSHMYDEYLNMEDVMRYEDVYISRAPSEEHTKLGVLTSIKYPTGSTQIFDYESNSFSRSGEIGQNGYYLKYSPPFTEGAPGLRIAKITLGEQVKKYKYVETFDPNNPDYIPGINFPTLFVSTGILYRKPALSFINTALIYDLSILGESPITYSKVIEYNQDKSYTVYTLNSVLDFPDKSNIENSNYYNIAATGAYASVPDNRIFNRIPRESFLRAFEKRTSCALERGKISKIEIYDASNNIKQLTKYTYNQDVNRYSQYIAGINPYHSPHEVNLLLSQDFHIDAVPTVTMLHSYCNYYFPNHLTKEEVFDYHEGNKTTTRITEYKYNSKRLLEQTTVYDSKAGNKKMINKYPQDFNVTPYINMISKHMISPVIEQITSSNGIETSRIKTSYYQDSTKTKNLILPQKVETTFTGTVNYQTDKTYDLYDSKGNLLQYTGLDGVKVYYIWSYNGQYPIAEIKSSSYTYSEIETTVKSALVVTSIDVLNNSAPNAKSIESELKDGSLQKALSNALVTTYTYKPLVGMTSSTDPRGYTTYYDYDLFGRLKETYFYENGVKKTLQTYDYRYRNQ